MTGLRSQLAGRWDDAWRNAGEPEASDASAEPAEPADAIDDPAPEPVPDAGTADRTDGRDGNGNGNPFVWGGHGMNVAALAARARGNASPDPAGDRAEAADTTDGTPVSADASPMQPVARPEGPAEDAVPAPPAGPGSAAPHAVPEPVPEPMPEPSRPVTDDAPTETGEPDAEEPEAQEPEAQDPADEAGPEPDHPPRDDGGDGRHRDDVDVEACVVEEQDDAPPAAVPLAGTAEADRRDRPWMPRPSLPKPSGRTITVAACALAAVAVCSGAALGVPAFLQARSAQACADGLARARASYDAYLAALDGARDAAATDPASMDDTAPLDDLNGLLSAVRSAPAECPADATRTDLDLTADANRSLTEGYDGDREAVADLTGRIDGAVAAKSLADAKTALASRLDDARATLSSSDGRTADNTARDALAALIDGEAAQVTGDDPQPYLDMASRLAEAANAVDRAVADKAKADADAQAAADAAAKAEEERRAAEEQRQREQEAAQAAADAARRRTTRKRSSTSTTAPKAKTRPSPAPTRTQAPAPAPAPSTDPGNDGAMM